MFLQHLRFSQQLSLLGCDAVSLGVSDFPRDLVIFIIGSNQSMIVTLEDEVARSFETSGANSLVTQHCILEYLNPTFSSNSLSCTCDSRVKI
jgi:hypothetical protein